MQALFEKIDSLSGEYLQFLKDICLIEAISADKTAVNKVVDFIEKFCVKKGFSSTRHSWEKAGDYIAIDVNEDKEEKGYLFVAHTDTVHKPGKFGEPAVYEEDGKLYGPGTIDCKGGIAVALLAMQSLLEMGEKRHMRLILTSDEETSTALSGKDGVELMKKWAKGFKGAFCCEVGEKGKITVGRKGIMRFRFDITGIPSHSGIAYFDGRSAIREAAHKIIALEQNSKEGTVTYNCGHITGGEVINIVPRECSFLLDVRFVGKEDMKEAEQTVHDIAKKSFVEGTCTKLTKISERLYMQRTAGNDSLFKKIAKVCDEYGFEQVQAYIDGGGSDAAYTVAAGVDSVCSVGTTGKYCHTKDEYAEIDSLFRRAKMLAAVCLKN